MYPRINTYLVVTADAIACIIETSSIILISIVVVVHLSPSRTLARMNLDTHLMVYSQVLRGAAVVAV